MKREFQLLARREFLAAGARAAATAATLAPFGSKAAPKDTPNPFAYDVGRFSKTDPKLIAYEENARWKCPHREPRRIAIAPDQQLYICSGNHIAAVNHDGQRVFEIALREAARCVGVANDGTVFVGLRDHIEVFDANGERRATWNSLGRKTWFTGLAVGENDIFAADSGSRVVLRYDKSGKLIGRIGEKNKERGILGFIVPSPFLDVEIHRDGLLRINNPGRHRVEAYTFDGEFKGAWGKPSALIDGFCGCCNPIGIALLPDGRCVTCEKGVPRVKVYSANGEFESVVADTESFLENVKACSSLNDCVHGGLDAAVDTQGRIYILDLAVGDIRVMKRKV